MVTVDMLFSIVAPRSGEDSTTTNISLLSIILSERIVTLEHRAILGLMDFGNFKIWRPMSV